MAITGGCSLLTHHSLKLIESGLHVLAEQNIGALVESLVAVFGRREDRDDSFASLNFVAFFFQLVGTY